MEKYQETTYVRIESMCRNVKCLEELREFYLDEITKIENPLEGFVRRKIQSQKQ